MNVFIAIYQNTNSPHCFDVIGVFKNFDDIRPYVHKYVDRESPDYQEGNRVCIQQIEVTE